MSSEARQRVLLVQDHSTAQRLQGELEKNGLDAACRATGAEGLEYLRRYLTHLIVLETNLPDGSGFDFCHQIRRAGFQQPVLMLSHQDSELDKVLGLEMGADDYVTKPFSTREILSRIRALLRRAYGELSMAVAERLCVGDLLIEQWRGRVWRGSEMIRLTPTEFRLLVYLAQNANQVRTRSQILDAIWGYDANIDGERIVNTTICRLREKIECDPAQPALIQTVNGIGYCLER